MRKTKKKIKLEELSADQQEIIVEMLAVKLNEIVTKAYRKADKLVKDYGLKVKIEFHLDQASEQEPKSNKEVRV